MKQSRVQSFWYGEKLSQYETMCINSFLANGHEFDVYSYTPDLNVPHGCNLVDAAEIMPESEVVFYQHGDGKGSVSLFSNLFRYNLLFQKGGWWVDLDVVCQTDDLPSDPYVFGYQDEGSLVCSAVIKVPAGDDLMERCFRKAAEIGTRASWGQTGPKLLSAEITSAGLGDFVRPASEIFPYNWESAMNALEPAHAGWLEQACKDARFVHLWSEILRRYQIDKNKPVHPTSLIGKFFQQYGEPGSISIPAPHKVCSDKECLQAAFSIDAPLLHKLANKLIASRCMHNTKLYIRATGHAPNYITPRTYSEKLQCRKLFDRNAKFTIFCDKLRAHEYAAKSDASVRSPEIHWSGEDPEQIPFDDLPVPCIIKPNHRSGAKYVVQNAEQIDRSTIVKLCRSWLEEPHGQAMGEWAYSKVTPKIQVEQLLPAPMWKPHPDHYEISVFSGRVEYIQHISSKEYFGRFTTTFDRNWKRLKLRKWTGWAEEGNHVREYLENVARPEKLDQMIEIAECLAENLDHLRVDLYCVNETVFLGELTVYPGSGHDYLYPQDAQYDQWPPRDIDLQIGSLWQQKQMSVFSKVTSLLFR
ncbi:ATP-grasp fold amidoligase family protein [Anderseniella sp. Alg231-50]|uniref:ATP-grasp fold amidoligase family protein n=1 Tax=Anderseniella sp. Alg231-50 TaxID=1922226 RepID=UPI000D54FA61